MKNKKIKMTMSDQEIQIIKLMSQFNTTTTTFNNLKHAIFVKKNKFLVSFYRAITNFVLFVLKKFYMIIKVVLNAEQQFNVLKSLMKMKIFVKVFAKFVTQLKYSILFYRVNILCANYAKIESFLMIIMTTK